MVSLAVEDLLFKVSHCAVSLVRLETDVQVDLEDVEENRVLAAVLLVAEVAHVLSDLKINFKL